MNLHGLVVIAIVIGTTISGWITYLKMRRRMSRALGRKVKDEELTSISTWMKAEEEEERRRGGKLQ